MTRRGWLLLVGLAVLMVAAPAVAQPAKTAPAPARPMSATPTQAAKPDYLPYAAFGADDTPAGISIKQSYNEAVEKYNKALYEYFVTLDHHDQLVERANGTANPADLQKAKSEAGPLRSKLQALRKEIATFAQGVDQAKRRAAQAGVALTR